MPSTSLTAPWCLNCEAPERMPISAAGFTTSICASSRLPRLALVWQLFAQLVRGIPSVYEWGHAPIKADEFGTFPFGTACARRKGRGS
mmetsp:Transcript_150918/g.383714  ORF Transcript_150918/g.383714 Transcript_150918/m.383714 type:complete len:88 (+) Transcript_150918:400-663(+)